MRKQLSINLSVARSCFVRCRGCYNHFGAPGTLVSTEAIVEFLAFARRQGVKQVTLCGGDPLSRTDIVTLLEQIKALGIAIHLDTVGTPMLGAARTIFFGVSEVSRVSSGDIARLVDLVGIPVDGSSNTSVQTFRAGRPHLLDEQLAILAALNGAGARICINTVVHQRNLEDIANLPPLLAFPAVVRWQLFQFTPTGPMGYRNRTSFVISSRAFAAMAAHVSSVARRTSGFGAEMEFKSSAERKGNYLLVDSEGLAWVPRESAGSRWDTTRDETSERFVLGDIHDPASHAPILDVIMRPRARLPRIDRRITAAQAAARHAVLR